MSGILSAIEDAAMRGPRALARLIAETTFPRVEGRTVTFLYQGEAQEVTLQHWIHGLPPSLPLRRVHGSDVFVLQVDLPPGSRMEYKFGVMMFGRGAMVRDPLNPQSARDPFGANSVVYGEGYRPPEWSTEDPDARHRHTRHARHRRKKVHSVVRPRQDQLHRQDQSRPCPGDRWPAYA